MTLMTGDQYRASVAALGLEAHVLGQRTGDLTEHPLVAPSLRAVAATYDGAHAAGTRALFGARSSLTCEEVNRGIRS